MLLTTKSVARVLLVGSMLIIAGCPYTVTGHLWSVRAHIAPRPIDDIRVNVLSLGGFEGPLKLVGGSSCVDGKHFEKTLPQSGVRVSVFDCYGKSNFSETGWIYSVSVATATPTLEKNTRMEIDALVAEIRKVVESSVGKAIVTTSEMELGHGFSLIPY